jgi:hypothetical protein
MGKQLGSNVFRIIYYFISYDASRYVMSPPIREAGHGKALQAALSSGILQVTHLCHTLNCRVKQIAYCLSAFLHWLFHRIDGILIAERQCLRYLLWRRKLMLHFA